MKYVEQAEIAADTPLRRDWAPRSDGAWLCQGKSGRIYARSPFGDFFLVWEPPPPPVCECGVKYTGGLCSDWCPAAGQVSGDPAHVGVSYAIGRE